MEQENNNVQGTVTNLGSNITPNQNTGIYTNPQPVQIQNSQVETTIPQVQAPVQPQQLVQPPVMNSVPPVQPVQPQQTVMNNVQQPVVNNTQTQVNNVQQPVVNTVQPQQPVVGGDTVNQSTVRPQQPVVNNTQPVQPTTGVPVQQPSDTGNKTEVPQVEKPKEPVISDKFVIQASDLQKLVRNSSKIATNDDKLPATQSMYLILNEDGFTILSTNGIQTMKITSDNVKYTKEFRISVEAEKFTKLVTALDDELVEFIYDEQQEFITLHTSTGAFQFGKKTDMGTGLEIVIEPPEIMPVENMVDIDYGELLEVILKSRPIRNLAKQGNSRIRNIFH